MAAAGLTNSAGTIFAFATGAQGVDTAASSINTMVNGAEKVGLQDQQEKIANANLLTIPPITGGK